MRVILDPHVALVLERSRPTVLSPEEALRRMHGVKGVTVALTDVSVPDSVAPPQHLPRLSGGLPGGKLSLINRIRTNLAQAFFATAEDVERLYAANRTATATAYPLALRRGLEALEMRPEGRWMFLEAAGPKAWLSVWDDGRLVHWRHIGTSSDLGAEVASAIHEGEPVGGPPMPCVALTPNADLLSVLTHEGVRSQLLEGPSPAFQGLEGLEFDAHFWLPEALRAQDERLRRRRRLQRAVAVVMCVGAIGVAEWAEWLGSASRHRVFDAEQALQRLAGDRGVALRQRADHIRRQLNHSGVRAWTAALTTLTPADRPTLRASLEPGNWKVELETTSLESAQRFAAAFGGRPSIKPRNVSDRLGWMVTIDIPERAWIGWPSQ